jgi:hypothetical protein
MKTLLIGLLASALAMAACTAQAQITYGDYWVGEEEATVVRL